MATPSFFTLLDDIALLADDVALASKQAVSSTAGILSDDIAVGAKKATGFSQSRELAVIYEITKGSFLNKIIILPIIFLLNFYFPIVITFLLVLGGIYLAFEGVEGVIHWFENKKQKQEKLIQKSQEQLQKEEKQKIKQAIKTDFILSIEIIIIALSSVKDFTLLNQSLATIFVALIATVGVYGLVALIVKIDDFGLYLMKKEMKKLGLFLVNLMPKIIKSLSVIGVIAMLLVAGGIFNHNIPFLHFENHWYISIVYDTVIAFVIGLIPVAALKVYKKIKNKDTIV